MFAMIGIGVGEIVGSIAFGKIMDKYGHRKSIIFLMIITGISFLLAILVNNLRSFSILCYLMTFVWGC